MALVGRIDGGVDDDSVKNMYDNASANNDLFVYPGLSY